MVEDKKLAITGCLKKLTDTGTVNRLTGIGRPRSAAVKKMLIWLMIWRSIHERAYDSYPTYAGRKTSIPHHLLFKKNGASTTCVYLGAGSE